MKLKTLILPVIGFCMTAMSAHSALILTFSQEGGDVVLTYTGSVDLTNANFTGDAGLNRAGVFNSVETNRVQFHRNAPSGGVVGADFYTGQDRLAGNLVNATFTGTADAGNSSQVFQIVGNSFQIVANNDNLPDYGVFSPSGFITFSGETFASMGLDTYTPHVLIDLWAARAGATNDELVQFVIIPEPSSTALLSLGGLALILRRRRL